ncbi:biotin-dependent carboxyltransferase family protein [Hymenobacter terrigena]
MSLRILRPGLLTTVQDLGRFGYQQDGIIVSGAADTVALRVGNLLVGNAETAAGLEITLLGPKICFDADHLIAVTGAHLSPTLNGQPVGRNRAIWLAAGAELAFGPAVAGCRAYLAVAGGVAAPLVLGSRSTYLRAGFGGLDGRALRAGDVLPIGEPSATGAAIEAALFNSQKAWNQARFTPGPDLWPMPRPEPIIRAVRGPEYVQFSAESQQAFWQEPFTVSTEADRMGCRLQGPGLERLEATELLSSAVTFGTVQVPAGGQPIVLLADHQTTGGYPRIAQVISADFSALAQLRPGQRLRFQEVALDEAQALYLAQEVRVRGLRRGITTVFGDCRKPVMLSVVEA